MHMYFINGIIKVFSILGKHHFSLWWLHLWKPESRFLHQNPFPLKTGRLSYFLLQCRRTIWPYLFCSQYECHLSGYLYIVSLALAFKAIKSCIYLNKFYIIEAIILFRVAVFGRFSKLNIFFNTSWRFLLTPIIFNQDLYFLVLLYFKKYLFRS